jgi:ABC-type amino acid transport system permease subunit
LPELVYVSEVIGAKTFAYTEVYIVAACLYIAVAFVISEFMEYLYKKLKYTRFNNDVGTVLDIQLGCPTSCIS